jgi:hypothetical protein
MIVAKVIPFDMYREGKYFGYPECCTNALRNHELTFGESAFTGSGYIPCDTCAKKPYDELVAEIQRNRVCSIPFPNGSGLDPETRKFTEEFYVFMGGIDTHAEVTNEDI